jgi:hypothetical protein
MEEIGRETPPRTERRNPATVAPWRGFAMTEPITVGSLCVTTTHALFALKVQRKVSNGGWIGPRRIISGSAEIAAIPAPLSERPTLRASIPAGHPGIRPELRIPHAAAQTRIVSVARIRLDSRKSVRPFKGIFCDDISEFESYMASHAVGSL